MCVERIEPKRRAINLSTTELIDNWPVGAVLVRVTEIANDVH